MKRTAPYGTWPSPISPQSLGQSLRLEDVQWDSDGQTLVWLQSRSDRTSLMVQVAGDATRELTGEFAVRGGVGYGGGDFTVSQRQVIFAERSGRLYRQSLGHGQPVPITPAYGGVASPKLSPDGRWIAYVFSDGRQDLLGLADATGQEWPLQLARGADFYMQPAWHPTGAQLAWVEWNHPNMPWDGSLIRLAQLEGTPPRVAAVQTVGGGSSTPASQPVFSPDGRYLAFVEAAGDWEQLVLLDLQQGSRRVLLAEAGVQLTTPDWVQGQRTLAWSYDSQGLFSIRNAAGSASLAWVSLAGAVEPINAAPYTWLSMLSASPTSRQLALVASAPDIPTRILRWDGSAWHVVARSNSEALDPAWLPQPEAIQWRATDGSPVYGLFYPPTSSTHQSGGLPPAIFNIHGGPTAQAVVAFNGQAAYFTSRGFAYVEVNYRGSSGYGRTYQDALKQHWGEYDVEDAVSGQQALAAQKRIDPLRSVIQGGSAGGYTVLNALVRHPGVFKAGVCLYGVSNLFSLDLDTHKFEQHYTQSLVGELPAAAARYHAWSPVFQADQIRDPLIIFQGSVDKVVPPSQSEEIVAALRANGASYRYVIYEGEGHGFRKSENIANRLEETDRFLLQHVLFAP